MKGLRGLWQEIVRRWKLPPAKVRILMVLANETEPLRGMSVLEMAEVSLGRGHVLLRDLDHEGLVLRSSHPDTLQLRGGRPYFCYMIRTAGRQHLRSLGYTWPNFDAASAERGGGTEP